MARDFLTSHVEMVRKQAYTHKRNQGFFGLAIDTRQGFVFLQGLLSGFVLVKALMLLVHENHENCAAYSVTELEIMQPNPSLSGHSHELCFTCHPFVCFIQRLEDIAACFAGQGMLMKLKGGECMDFA